MHIPARFGLLAATLLAACPAFAGKEESSTALTIYTSAQPGAVSPDLYRYGNRGMTVPGYAVVKQERALALNRGENSVNITDVAAQIDPTTVLFESLTDPAGTRVEEQNFQFDLVSNEKLLQKFIDREITVEQVRGDKVESFTGTLLSASAGGMVLKTLDGVQIIPQNAAVKLPSLPGGLLTRPTLVWELNAREPGSQKTRVTYQTAGMTWWADYNLTFAEGHDADSCSLDVSAWVSILNQSGAGYPGAKLKLVAGDVQRAIPLAGFALRKEADEARVAQAPAFQEKAFFEYHLYTLDRSTTLPDNSTKQIELFPAARRVACEKTLVYYGGPQAYYGYAAAPLTDRDYGIQSNKKVDVYLSFKNSAGNNMGMPVPAGRVRVNKLDPADNTLEFIGENTIDHTPTDENVLIKLGSAFDVVGERKQTDYKIDTSRKTLTEEIEIKLRNHKNEPVKVVVKENMYRWTNWKILAATGNYEKEDSRTVHFPVRLPKQGETTLRYSVQYTW